MGNIYKRILKYLKLWPRTKFHKEILEHERHIKQQYRRIKKIRIERGVERICAEKQQDTTETPSAERQ